jgi:hypothetical protein
MSNTATILGKVQTQLRNSSYLSYVDNNFIFLGVRDNITNFPCIVIEPDSNDESDLIYGKQSMVFRVIVTAHIQVFDKDKQLQGDTVNKGILDLENDIKKAISADRTLGITGSYVFARITATTYEFVEYPIRSVAILLEIEFRQNTTTRT